MQVSRCAKKVGRRHGGSGNAGRCDGFGTASIGARGIPPRCRNNEGVGLGSGAPLHRQPHKARGVCRRPIGPSTPPCLRAYMLLMAPLRTLLHRSSCVASSCVFHIITFCRPSCSTPRPRSSAALSPPPADFHQDPHRPQAGLQLRAREPGPGHQAGPPREGGHPGRADPPHLLRQAAVSTVCHGHIGLFVYLFGTVHFLGIA